MGEVKQIKIKNQTYYFYNDEINSKDFDTRLLRINKKNTRRLTFIAFVIWLFKKNASCNNINSVNPLFLND